MARPPPFGTGMSSDIPHMIQQRARQTANVVAAKRAVFGLGPVLLRLDLGEAVPFPVRRQDCGEQLDLGARSEEHTSELQSLMRISYAVFCLKKKINNEQSSTTTMTTH